MKLRRRILLTALATATAWATPGLAQSGSDNEAPAERAGRSESVTEDHQQVSRFMRDPAEAPEALRAQLLSLRQAQVANREAWIEEYRPGDGATAGEIKEARERFQSERSEEIEASRELRAAVMLELRASPREVGDDAAWDEQTREIYADYRASQARLGEAWRAVRAELGKGATRREVRSARERFKQANADLIGQQKRLAEQVPALIREDRYGPSGMRNDVPEALKGLRDDMAALREQVRARQREAREEMVDLSKEEREQYRRNMLEDLRELHDEIKQRRRQVIDEIRDGKSGDRLPEE